MHKLNTSTLFHQLLTELKCPFLYSIVSSNEENILEQVNSFSLDRCNFVELFIRLDLLTLCNLFPSSANQLFTNSCSVLQYVKENVIQILTKLLKNLTNLSEKFEKLIFLSFKFENIPFLNNFNFREFYFTIHNKSIKESNLIIIEGKYTLTKKKVASLLKYYRCTNDVCSQSCYILEQESHLPDKSQVNYFLVDKIENTIKTMIDIDQFDCPHCKNELKENITERNVKFLYFYTIYKKLFFINGISFEELKNDLILIGKIKRINLIPHFFILCYSKKEELKSNLINYTAISTRYSSLPLLLKNIYNFSHSSFILDDITHINLHLILSIFLIKEIRLVIFTNDPFFVNNHAQSFFKLHSLNIKISIEEDSHLQNELLIYDEKNIHQLNYSNYNFIIELKKCLINYEYKSNNKRILLDKHEMKENDIQFVQKIFLNLRKVFKNNISLVKLLDVINNIKEALYFYLVRIPNEDDLRIVEQTCAKCLVPDLKIKI